MKVFIIGMGQFYSGFNDAVLAARRLSGCPVVVLTDGTFKNHTDISPYYSTANLLKSIWDHSGLGYWTYRTTARWAFILDYCKANNVEEPIFSADWDVLIFDDLNKTHAPWNGCDLTWMQIGGMTSEPYGVKHYSVIENYLGWLVREINAGNYKDFPCGMFTWNTYVKTNSINAGNLNQIVNDSIFDGNIQECLGEFENDGKCKLIHWIDGRPYFREKATGKSIKANIVHCWGEYKQKTHELINRVKW